MILLPFLISLILTPVVKQYSIYCGAYAKENKRTVHHGKISRIGGVAIYLSFIITMAIFVKADFIHSSTQNKDEILDCFRNKKLSALVCTTLLERGITIPSVQVVVFKGDHSVFTTASLIQIFGRVGRSFKDPEGKGVCLCQASSESIKDCVSQITKMNDTVYVATKK